MVDYKKWDKFIADLSSDEEDNNYGTRVTTLPERSSGRVTIGPQGYHIHQEGEEQAPYDDMQDSEEDGIDYEEDVDLPPKHIFQHISSQKGTQKTSTSTSSSSMPVSDRVEYIDDSTPSTLGSSNAQQPHTTQTSKTVKNVKKVENGYEGTLAGCQYYWSQDRYEVVLNVILPMTTIEQCQQIVKRDIQLTFDEILKKLQIIHRVKKQVLFEGNFQYAVELVGDPTNPYDEVLDWELIKDNNSARIEITMKKKCPIANATIWWERVFINEPKLDVTKIAGRSNPALQSLGMDPLQQAHLLFQQKIKEQQAAADNDSRIEVGVPSDDEADS